MNRHSARGHAAIVMPLLGAVLVITYLVPTTAHPLFLALAPLGWAAFVVIATGIEDILAAYAWALPFSAYGVVAFADGPRISVLAAALSIAVTGAAASVAVAALSGDSRTGTARWLRNAMMLAGWLPGCAAAIAAGPWPGVAVAILTTLVALYIRARSSR